jgi:hypothetical protein
MGKTLREGKQEKIASIVMGSRVLGAREQKENGAAGGKTSDAVEKGCLWGWGG